MSLVWHFLWSTECGLCQHRSTFDVKYQQEELGFTNADTKKSQKCFELINDWELLLLLKKRARMQSSGISLDPDLWIVAHISHYLSDSNRYGVGLTILFPLKKHIGSNHSNIYFSATSWSSSNSFILAEVLLYISSILLVMVPRLGICYLGSNSWQNSLKPVPSTILIGLMSLHMNEASFFVHADKECCRQRACGGRWKIWVETWLLSRSSRHHSILI